MLVRRETRHVYETSVVFQIGLCVGSSTAPFKALVKVDGKQAVSDGVQTSVEEAKDEEHVSERMRHRLLHFLGKQPVPQAEQVVGSPADDEGRHDDDAHLQSPHPGFGDVVVGAAEVHVS